MDGQKTLNYIRLRSLRPFTAKFAIIDSAEHYADQLFIDKKLPVTFKEHYIHPDTNYQIIFCNVKRNRVEDFIDAIEKLHNKMLLLGHTDYENACQQFQDLINSR